jgi:DNA polymerase III alpha subunit|tara:strand:- start:2094 stop:2642 length:549 start_codon:yes stop_codon:yes gene_type:complete
LTFTGKSNIIVVNGMRMNKNKQYVVSEQDIVTGWLSGSNVTDVVVEDTKPINIYNEWCQTFDLDQFIDAKTENNTDTYVEDCLRKWNMPDNYMNINIHEWLMKQCTTAQQRDRVYTELLEYEKRGMVIVLKFLLYLVDTCEKHDIVLGVGRGSSVASYCLYLLGIHCVDSIKYKLDIKEFLK